MKRAAIIFAILAAIVFVVFIFIENQGSASGAAQARVTPVNQSLQGEVPTASPDISAIKEGDQVVAEGRLVPNKFVNLSFNTGGLVETVYVQEGDIVEAGQLLAELSSQEEILANIASAKLELVSAQNEVKSLYDQAPLAAAEALQDIASAPSEVAAAERKLNNLQGGIVDETDIEIARANVGIAEKELEKAREAYQPYANKPESNLTRAALLSKLSEAEKKYENALRNLNALTGGPTEEKISQAQAELALARVRLADARRRYEILKNGPDPDQLALAQARLDNAEAQLAAAQSALEKLQLRAPFAGTIASLDLKVGEYVAPGEPVVLLVDFTDWQLETTDLSELNIVRISAGSPAVITCDALPDVPFPGRVAEIKPIGENKQGEINYTVLVNMNQFDDRLLWNMTCSVVFFPDFEQPNN
jgi:multidrug resistance efflux pump